MSPSPLGSGIAFLAFRSPRVTEAPCHTIRDRSATAVPAAFNDMQSIGAAVGDFAAHPPVRRAIAIDNNSRDATFRCAAEAGAAVVVHREPGYGQCACRALGAASAFSDTELTPLCEADCTFRAFDIEKSMAYVPHADIVDGTRIVGQLRRPRTQLTAFMYYGGFAAGKPIELKHIGLVHPAGQCRIVFPVPHSPH